MFFTNRLPLFYPPNDTSQEQCDQGGPEKKRKVYGESAELPIQDLNFSLSIPPRQRGPLSNAMMGDAGNATRGKAIPSLLPGEFAGP